MLVSEQEPDFSVCREQTQDHLSGTSQKLSLTNDLVQKKLAGLDSVPLLQAEVISHMEDQRDLPYKPHKTALLSD